MAKKKKNGPGRPEMSENEKRVPFPGKFKPCVIKAIQNDSKQTGLSRSYIVETILIKYYDL